MTKTNENAIDFENANVKSSTLFGKSTISVGSLQSELLLRSNGKIKLQWGNKFIDLLKNGKLNIDRQEFIFTVDSEEDIEKDGIYIVKDDIYINKDKNIIKLTDSDQFVSFTNDLEKTIDEKTQALKNIGIIYDDINLLLKSNIENGIAYVVSTGELYLVKDKALTKIEIQQKQEIYQETQEVNTSLVLNNPNELKIKINDNIYQSFKDDQILSYKDNVLNDNIKLRSKNGNMNEGFMLGNQNGEWTLYIDNIISRKPTFTKGMIMMYHGESPIPDGWAICDGLNGTPDLTNRFIKAVSSLDDDGKINNDQLDENNNLLLLELHLPNHNHSVTITLNEINYIDDIETEIINVDLSELDQHTAIKSISTNNKTIEESELIIITNDSDFENIKINIQPQAYALVFIMKL